MKDPFFEREAEKYAIPIASRKFILSYLKNTGKPASLETIAEAFNLQPEDQKAALHRRLRAMERDGQLVFTRRKYYVLPEKLDMIKGSVIAHRDGFGFLKVDGNKEDYFLPPDQMRLVLQGDTVLAQPLFERYRGKLEARIVRILEPRNHLIVGRYYIEGGAGFVVPDDSRLNFDILLTEKADITLRMGAVVVVELLKRPNRSSKATGRIVEVLGENMETDLAIEIAVRNHEIPHILPDVVLQEAENTLQEISDLSLLDRIDLRQLSLVTIDGEDARDFDDAVYCERKGNGWRLVVAIADVSYYVTPKSPLDKEAFLRGTSVYFPSRVIPMLPEALSNGICSLNPEVDRLCLVCDLIFDGDGNIQTYCFYEAVMNSRARLTYNKVFSLLQGAIGLRRQYSGLVPNLECLQSLYRILMRNRRQRGAIGFENPEPKFIFTADKRIESIEVVERNEAYKIIEECMIAANVAAADFVKKADTPGLYRVHEMPDNERIVNLKAILAELGITLGGGDKPTPKDIAQLLLDTGDRPDHEMIQTLILRSLKQAVYEPENRGHFGLALDAYTHFTSPIRRYPDLLLHRVIKWILAHQKKTTSQTGGYRYSNEDMLYFGEHCSFAERRADDATRDVIDWLKCDFMLDHVGEEFTGIISGVTNFGFFVRLDNLYIDGIVHVSTLENDYYYYDAARHRLIGEASGYTYQLGDRVRVKLESVNLEEHKIDFSLLSSEKKPRRVGKTEQDNIKKIEKKSKNKRAFGKKRLKEKKRKKSRKYE